MKPKKPHWRLRLIVTWGTVLYLLALIGMTFTLEHCTERQWYYSPLLYLPPLGWLLPLVVLVPLALFYRQVMLLLHLLAVIIVFTGYMHYHAPPEDEKKAGADPVGPVLTVITANIGQRPPKTVQPFLDQWDADVIAFQEAIYREKAFTLDNPGYNVRVEGEFSLATKLPIKNSGIVPDLTFEGRPVCAWFELRFHNRSIVIYSVHMPTPRRYLMNLRGGGVMSELFRGGGMFSQEMQDEYKYSWDFRFNLMRGLLAFLEKEKRPTIMVGDFNTPDHGSLYKHFAAAYVDTFAAVGKGYGPTFPADVRSPLALYRPWLRLDYQFVDDNWRPLECAVEHLARAQHLAVAATYEFTPDE
jgi:endonuclease/exonuclease/phosphatase (EEP) superfamily protein YafD